MDSFYTNLNSCPERSKRYRNFLIITTIILIAIAGIAYWIFYAFSIFDIRLTLFLCLHTAVYFYVVYKGYKSELYIKSDRTVLSYKLSLYKRTPDIIIWESVKKVKIGPTYIRFYKRSGKRKTMLLGWISYVNIIQVKRNIESIVRQLNIEFEYGEIIEYVE